MLKVRHEQKILSTGQLCAQGIGWDLSLSQSCPVEVLARIPTQKTLSRPSTSWLLARESPWPARPLAATWRNCAPGSLSLDGASPSSLPISFPVLLSSSSSLQRLTLGRM